MPNTPPPVPLDTTFNERNCRSVSIIIVTCPFHHNCICKGGEWTPNFLQLCNQKDVKQWNFKIFLAANPRTGKMDSITVRALGGGGYCNGSKRRIDKWPSSTVVLFVMTNGWTDMPTFCIGNWMNLAAEQTSRDRTVRHVFCSLHHQENQPPPLSNSPASQYCGSALVSRRIRIQLFISMRFRIQGAKPMRIWIPILVRL